MEETSKSQSMTAALSCREIYFCHLRRFGKAAFPSALIMSCSYSVPYRRRYLSSSRRSRVFLLLVSRLCAFVAFPDSADVEFCESCPKAPT